MIKISDIIIPLNAANVSLREIAAKKLKVPISDIKNVKYIKKSIDARKKNAIVFVITIAVNVKNEKALLKRFHKNKNILEYVPYHYNEPSLKAHTFRPVVVGFGPAGMFAGLLLAKAGLKPIILEMGYNALKRKETVDIFRKTGTLDENCNIQFGEGGAGTFSDGKLNTGIKDMRIMYVLETFVRHGAPENILYTAKPHIGTDFLINVVQSIRREIEDLGGEVLFESKFIGYETDLYDALKSVIYMNSGNEYSIRTNNCILATGHSSRDVFRMLKSRNIRLAAKNFAMGVRIEHLQSDLNQCMYGKNADNKALPAADYKLAVHLPNGHSLYTFCMCPGGEVVAAASENKRLVVNGMSVHKRNGINSNSALLIGIYPEKFGSNDPLYGMYLQEKLENQAFIAGGGNYNAPVNLVGDFLEHRVSKSFGKIKPTYIPGTKFALPDEYLPDFMTDTLRYGIPELAKKLQLFNDPEAILTGIESRSSSPVRILRNEYFQSVSISGLYPCGEGAGYAGGITSAAVDGLKCAEAIIAALK